MENPDDSALFHTPSKSIDHEFSRKTITRVEDGPQVLPDLKPESSGQISEDPFIDEEKGPVTEVACDPEERVIRRIVRNFTPSYVGHILTHFRNPG